MMRSMFAGVSGLRSHQVMLDVVGNNIANVNTTGFKASRVVFQDTLSQIVRGSSGNGEATAGINPMQVGLGVRVAGTDGIFSQGSSMLTDRATDVAIQGDGFFAVRLGTETLYTRAGAFSFDANGFLVDPTGAVVQGWIADTDGTINPNAPVGDIRIPLSQTIAPTATTTVQLGGNLSADAATGEEALTAIDVIDAEGAPNRVTFSFTKTGVNTWELTVAGPDGTVVGTDTLSFDPASGHLVPPASPLTYTITPANGAAPLTFTVDPGAAGQPGSLTQYGGPSDAQALSQDGTASGYLRSFAISDDGIVSGVFSNGANKPLAQLALATFANPAGLLKAGDSRYRVTSTSGQPLVGVSNTGGRGSINAGVLEMSNVDLAQEFTNLIIAQRGFQANSRVISTADEMLQDLVNLKR